MRSKCESSLGSSYT